MSSPNPKLDYVIHNCHVHLFNIDYIPRYYLSKLMPVTVAKKQWIAKTFYRLFKNKLHRYSAFFYSALRQSPREILEELRHYYPRRTKFVPLSIDFDYMCAGQCVCSFLKQLEDLAELKREFPEVIYPFVGVDPRRPEAFDLVKKYIEEHQFSGIKMYPSLGFFPDDERLMPIYAYAEKYELPITFHCIPKNTNHYRDKFPDEMIDKAREIPGFKESEAKSNYDFAQYLNHPYWMAEKVLPKFPNLKVNFGHFGGTEEWDRYLDNPFDPESDDPSWYSIIRGLMENPKYPNVYADISFTVYDQSLYPVLKNLVKSNGTKDYVLFGSDFYMLQKDYRERRFGLDVRGYLDDADYWQIAEVNPKRFLANKIHSRKSAAKKGKVVMSEN